VATSTSYGGFATAAEYAAEIKRKKAAGIAFTDPTAAAAFEAANPGLFGGTTGAVAGGTTGAATGVSPILGALNTGELGGGTTGPGSGATPTAPITMLSDAEIQAMRDRISGNNWTGSDLNMQEREILKAQAAAGNTLAASLMGFNPNLAAMQVAQRTGDTQVYGGARRAFLDQGGLQGNYQGSGQAATTGATTGASIFGALSGRGGAGYGSAMGAGPPGAGPPGAPGGAAGGPISTAITPWDPKTSPLYQAILAGYQSQVPEATGAVRQNWFERGPGMGESTWAKSAQAEMAQKVLGQATAQMPGIAQYETGLQESAIERAYREREFATGQEQTGIERALRQQELGYSRQQGEAATAESARRWEAEMQFNRDQLAADVKAKADASGTNPDEFDIGGEMNGFFAAYDAFSRNAKDPAGKSYDQLLRILEVGVMLGQYTEKEAALMRQALDRYIGRTNPNATTTKAAGTGTGTAPLGPGAPAYPTAGGRTVNQ